MNSNSIANQFARMGARFRVTRPDELPAWQRRTDYSIDVAQDRHGQIFELRLSEKREAQLDIQVLQYERRDRHLLLVKTPRAKDRFLCGHDEREWFVAAVPGGASSVAQAKHALQPDVVRFAADALGLDQRQRFRRHNRAFIRQGEWFFVPARSVLVDHRLILRNEALRRGSGKPHMVAELLRVGGETVYVTARHPNGLLEADYRKLIAQRPAAKQWGWKTMRRNPAVYVRGTVRHPDHATITLRDWHHVWMNTETATRQMANVAFLD